MRLQAGGGMQSRKRCDGFNLYTSSPMTCQLRRQRCRFFCFRLLGSTLVSFHLIPQQSSLSSKSKACSRPGWSLAVPPAVLGVCIHPRSRPLNLSTAYLAPSPCPRIRVPHRWVPSVPFPRRKRSSGVQAMLYATEGINDDADLQKAMVGVASVW